MARKTISKTTTTTTDPWATAVDALKELSKAVEVARVDFEVAREAAKSNPFAPGISAKVQLLNTLMDAEKALDMDMRSIARANAWDIPSEHELRGRVQ